MTTPYGDDPEVDETEPGEQPDQTQGGQSSEFRRNQRALQQRANERDEAVARADAATRELAFYKANLDMTNPAAKYFVKAYEGELTSEAITAAAEEAGLTKPAAGSGDTHPDPGALNPQAAADAAAFAQLNQATTGPTSASGTDHRAGMEKVAQDAMKAGEDVPQAVAAYMVRHGLPTTEDNV